MSRKRTREELESAIRGLEPYREACMSFMRGDVTRILESGERAIEVIGSNRAAGGVVIRMNGEPCAAMWLSELIARWSHSFDPYLKEIASKAIKLQVDGLAERERGRKEDHV